MKGERKFAETAYGKRFSLQLQQTSTKNLRFFYIINDSYPKQPSRGNINI
jgi:hypothetical protein